MQGTEQIKNFQDLKVWQKSVDLVEKVYLLTSKFPKEEIYSLTNQIRRSSVSVPSNISEGHARNSTKEFLRFISISLGSLAELKTQLILAERLGFIGKKELKDISEDLTEVRKMLYGLQRKLIPQPSTLIPVKK